MVTLALLAECARQAESGCADLAASRLLARSEDSDFSTLKGLMRYSLLSSGDIDRFHEAHDRVYCVRVERLGEFWLAPLECWDQLPSGATIMSPRGVHALGRALVESLAT